MKSQDRRAVGYVRVSDDLQVKGYSLDAQRSEIARWCDRLGFELVHVYSEEGLTAHTDRIEQRPQLVALLRDAELGKFGQVVVHTLDRWARNVGVQRKAMERLGKASVGFASITEGFDFTTPAGKLLLTTMGGVNEFFSDQLAVHVSKALRHRAELGLPVGPLPFAYECVEPRGIPQPVKGQAEAVLEVFQRRAAGESMGTIARWLNERGLRTREDGLFTAHAVKDMLNCRFYLGTIRYHGQEHGGQHEAIISEELFQRVQARKRKRTAARTVVGPKGVLQGMISCGNCGMTLQSDRHRYGGPMYRERHSHECITNGRSIMAKTVDEQIGAILTSVQLLPEWRERMVRLTVANQEGPSREALKEKRRRLSRAYSDGAFTDAEYEAKLAEIDGMMRLTEPTELPSIEDAANLFYNVPELWQEAMPEERRKLISPLIERAHVDMESGMIGAIVPVSAFRRLLEGAMSRADRSAALLLSEDEAERLKVWSWWRRGRVELPVHERTVPNLLQA